MSLENIFYIVGIVSMSLYTLLLIAVVILLFYIKKKLGEVAVQVEEKIDVVRYAVQHPGEIVMKVGSALAANAIDEVVKRTKKKKD